MSFQGFIFSNYVELMVQADPQRQLWLWLDYDANK